MPRSWLDSLDADQRAAAEDRIASLRKLGCPDPEHWARLEHRDGWPQQARYTLLRHLWSESIDTWRDSVLWIDNLRSDVPAEPDDAPASDAAQALGRLLNAGADPQDVARLARFVAYETVFSVVHTLDEGYDPEHDENLPGWVLMERDPLGHVTNRPLRHLHVDLPRLIPPPD